MGAPGSGHPKCTTLKGQSDRRVPEGECYWGNGLESPFYVGEVR
jgi:hypothetical protein